VNQIRDLRNIGEIAIEYINATRNLTDLFTKGLAHAVFDEASKEMGLKPT
jgi:hypothetical protein